MPCSPLKHEQREGVLSAHLQQPGIHAVFGELLAPNEATLCCRGVAARFLDEYTRPQKFAKAAIGETAQLVVRAVMVFGFERSVQLLGRSISLANGKLLVGK